MPNSKLSKNEYRKESAKARMYGMIKRGELKIADREFIDEFTAERNITREYALQLLREHEIPLAPGLSTSLNGLSPSVDVDSTLDLELVEGGIPEYSVEEALPASDVGENEILRSISELAETSPTGAHVLQKDYEGGYRRSEYEDMDYRDVPEDRILAIEENLAHILRNGVVPGNERNEKGERILGDDDEYLRTGPEDLIDGLTAYQNSISDTEKRAYVFHQADQKLANYLKPPEDSDDNLTDWCHVDGMLRGALYSQDTNDWIDRDSGVGRLDYESDVAIRNYKTSQAFKLSNFEVSVDDYIEHHEERLNKVKRARNTVRKSILKSEKFYLNTSTYYIANICMGEAAARKLLNPTLTNKQLAEETTEKVARHVSRLGEAKKVIKQHEAGENVNEGDLEKAQRYMKEQERFM